MASAAGSKGGMGDEAFKTHLRELRRGQLEGASANESPILSHCGEFVPYVTEVTASRSSRVYDRVE